MRLVLRLGWLCDLLFARLLGRALFLQAARFAGVGVINTSIDFCCFLFALAYLTSSLVTANLCSWLIAVSGSYVMNSFITFASESGGRLRLRAYLTFLASGVFALIANTTALLVAVNVLLLPVLAAKVLAIAVSFLVNFSLARLVVFRPEQPPATGKTI
jgi:putative flippase GtrA